MLTVEEKKRIVEDVTEKVKKSSGLYLANFNKVNVEKMTLFRNELRAKGLSIQVVKNTLLKRVFDDCQIKGLDEYLVGPTSLIFSSEDDPIEPAKVITKFNKENQDVFSIKAVQMESQVYSGDAVVNLSKMPGKRELQAQVISLAMGAGSGLIALVKGPGNMIAGQIKSLIEKLEK